MRRAVAARRRLLIPQNLGGGAAVPPAPSLPTPLYIVQLIEHPILRIPNTLVVYFLSIFPDKSFKLISKYAQKCQYNSLY